jgi:hypothetical protein
VDRRRCAGRRLLCRRHEQAAHPPREARPCARRGLGARFQRRLREGLGAVEILGAAGLFLPALLDVAPILSPFAAVGLALIMVGAAIVAFRRHEFGHVLVNLTYLALAVFVAWGRFGPESFG